MSFKVFAETIKKGGRIAVEEISKASEAQTSFAKKVMQDIKETKNSKKESSRF